MLNIILFGSPGSGKGTQSGNIINKYKLCHLATGDILRSEIADSTKLGLAAKNYIDNGELVPDNLVINIIRERINHCTKCKGFIFDGFPRTILQAEALDNILKENQSSISLMLELNVDHKELVKRIINRGITEGRSDDTNLQIIEKRMKIYHQETKPLIDYYHAQGKFHSIRGMGEMDDIFKQICHVISIKAGSSMTD